MQYDKNFLLELDRLKNRVIYARITKLTFSEEPIEAVEGKVTGGSINIDGTSSVRRTCSLSLAANNFDQINFNCGLETKFKLEIGIQNTINSQYPEIIWFNQGIYLITSFSTSRSATNFSLSISGKDKMCLLNGEVGGVLESSVDFGQIEEEDIYGNWTIKKIPIKDIIRNAVHSYGKEPYHNIIINDLEDCGVELLEYRYDTPLYLYREIDKNVYQNATFDGQTECKYKSSNTTIHFDDLQAEDFENLNDLVATTKKVIVINGKDYYVTKIQFGETCGYRLTDLTYPGDLIAKPGDSLVSVLDKIKNMLVEFEYFYNVDGQFVFQKKTSTLSVMQNLNPEEETELNKNMLFNDTVYTFDSGKTLISLNNNPNLLNLKNDYSIWGERVTASGVAVPIHLRYAVDKKPISYTCIEVSSTEQQVIDYASKYDVIVSGQSKKTYVASSSGWEIDSEEEIKCDWREVLYRMASDYYRYNFLTDFTKRVSDANGTTYLNGITGYENYYTDIYSFWRDLYNPISEEIEKQERILSAVKTETSDLTKRKTSLENKSNKTAEEERELSLIYMKLSYLEKRAEDAEGTSDIGGKLEQLEQKKENYYSETYGTVAKSKKRRCWNKSVFNASYSINFWFDFLDTKGILSQYSVSNIGDRIKAVNENTLKSVSYNKIPNVIYYNGTENIPNRNDYAYIQVGEHYDNMFSISGQGKSLSDRLNELINVHSFFTESVTINAVPVYYLEPNSRIVLSDPGLGINDVYLITKITLPLTYNGNMSISANKLYDSIV